MGEAQTANNLADAYVILGRMDEALDLLRRALELNREVGYRYGEGVALNNLGEAFLDLGRTEEAIECFHQARSTFAEINFPHGVGYALHNSGARTSRSGGMPMPWSICSRRWPFTGPRVTGTEKPSR